jgi:hypothetical protein
MKPSHEPELSEFQYYRQTHPARKRDYMHPSVDEMAHDLNVAHDFIKKLVTEKDQLRNRVEFVTSRLGWRNIWTRILVAAVVAQWAVIVILFKAYLAVPK